ncbi:NHL repeat-containing protein [candidate division KSB1 bacterium]
MLFKKICSVLFIISLSISCNTNPETFTVETSDDVRHVHNTAPLWGDEERISLEFVQKIGELEGDDENYHFYEPEDLAVNSENNIFILDRGNFKVKKYTSEGRFITSFGGQGQGPGEFDLVSGIDIDNDGTIYIYDLGFQGFHVFESSGKFIRSFRNGIITLQVNLLSSGNLIAMNYAVMDPLKLNEKPLIAIFNKDGDILKEFGKKKLYEDESWNITGNIFYFTTDEYDNVFITFPYQNRIEKYDKKGELILRINRELGFEESVRLLTTEYEDNEGKIYTKDITNQFSIAIQIDPAGRIWVQTFERQPEVEETIENKVPKENPFMLEVFDSDGILLCNIKPEQGIFPVKFKIYNNRLFIINALDMCVYEYKIVEK